MPSQDMAGVVEQWKELSFMFQGNVGGSPPLLPLLVDVVDLLLLHVSSFPCFVVETHAISVWSTCFLHGP